MCCLFWGGEEETDDLESTDLFRFSFFYLFIYSQHTVHSGEWDTSLVLVGGSGPVVVQAILFIVAATVDDTLVSNRFISLLGGTDL